MKKVFKDVIEVIVELDTKTLMKDCETIFKTLKAEYEDVTSSIFIARAIDYIMDYRLSGYTFYNPDILLCEKQESFENIYRGIEEYVVWYWKTMIQNKQDFEWSD